MKRKITVGIALVFLLGFAAASLMRGNSEYYDKYESYKYGFMPYYSSIESRCSDEDRIIAETVIDKAKEIMTDTQNGIHPHSGKLETYAPKFSIVNEEISKVTVDMNLITAKFSFGNGYMWVEYTKICHGTSDEVISNDSYLAYWKLKEENDIWTVSKIKEEHIN